MDLLDFDLNDQETGKEDEEEVVVSLFVMNTSLVRDIQRYST